jgi:AcrR family transcriptional regulator
VPASNERRRILEAASVVVGRAGYDARLAEIMRSAGIPPGSSYHYFPSGRAFLMSEMVTHRLTILQEQVTAAAADSVDFGGFVRGLVLGARAEAQRSGYAQGCVFGALLTTGSTPPAVVDEVARSWTRWAGSIAEVLVTRGGDPRTSRAAAELMVTVLQGATLLCRATHSLEPFDHVLAELPALVVRSVIQPTGAGAA